MAPNQDWATLRREATELGQEIRDLGKSYGAKEQRRLLCYRLLRLVVCAYTPPRELTEALTIALGIDPGLTPSKLGYGRKDPDKYKAAIMAEKRYLRRHGRQAPAYAIAREVSQLARGQGRRGLSPNSVDVWRETDPEYQMLAFSPGDLPD